MAVPFKCYLVENNDGQENEIRRLEFEFERICNFEDFKENILNSFPQLSHHNVKLFYIGKLSSNIFSL